MVLVVSIFVFLIVVGLFRKDLQKLHPAQVVLSPFWFFSFLFLIAFPLRAYLLNSDLVFSQVMQVTLASYFYNPTFLVYSLIASTVLWLCIYIGRRQVLGPVEVMARKAQPSQTSYRRVGGVLIGSGVLAIGALAAISYIFPPIMRGGEEYQLMRKGAGLLWTLPEFFILAVFGYFSWWAVNRTKRWTWFDYGVLAVIIVLSLHISGELHTRRIIAAVVMCAIALVVLRVPKYWPLALIGVLSTVLAAPVLEFLRSLYTRISRGDVNPFSQAVKEELVDLMLYRWSSTFEGAGHFGRFLQKSSFQDLLIGVDQGASWLFNFGLAFIPRSIWESKPSIYGGLEQFRWVYPNVVYQGVTDSAVPMSFAVDFSFGFGLVFALFLALVFGRLLGVAERAFWDPRSNVVDVALSLFIFVYAFNWVRNTTVLVQSIELLSIPLVIMFGFRMTLHRVFAMAGEAIGLVGGGWRSDQKIYFYPHRYLRERQLDTIRQWKGWPPINAEEFSARDQMNVLREHALTPSRPSWKSRIPLVNIKRRPKDVPVGACVYVWGGLINKGPFITDIDNPYAFTGYNVLAAKIYKFIIQSFLLSPRCLEIRCMSQACRDGMAELYGLEVARKCVVAYPKIKKMISAPKTAAPDRCRFVFISSQFELKGGAALLNAFERVVQNDPHAELVMVTYLPESFEERVKSIPNVTVLESNLSREEIRTSVLQDADVLVHPTYMDSFGMVILEGLACGLPIISTDVYAIREMVVDGKNGHLLTPPITSWDELKPSATFSDVAGTVEKSNATDTRQFEQQLYDAMVNMVRNPKQRERASAYSLALMEERFSL